MHKVTINSPTTDTDVDNEYTAMIFIGIPANNNQTIECFLLGNGDTNDVVRDATDKTKLLHALRAMEEKIIKSNKLIEIAAIIDPNFVDTFVKGKKMDLKEYKMRQTIRSIFNEGKGKE